MTTPSSPSSLPGPGPRLPTFHDVSEAAARLEGVAHRTPVMTSRTANEIADGHLYFKCENLQRAGAFKFRGAYNAICLLSAEQKKRGVVTYSSGNHAQAMALAGRLHKVATTVIMPSDAPAIKVQATQGYGGAVQFYDRYTEDREAIGRRLSSELGMSLIPPYDHPDVIAGQGTATLELLEETGWLDILFVGLGGGGLLAGGALAARALSPTCRIIGVEPDAGNDGQQSFRAGHIVRIPAPSSIADGAIVTHLGAHTFPIIRSLVDDVVTVSDEALVETMKFFAERMKLIVEPTGCLAAAAAMSRRFHANGSRVGVLVSGGNVDRVRFSELTRQG